jgi:hypothetical protein
VTGKFLLSYIPRDKVRHEFVSVTPEGFRFRKHNMDSVGQLIKWFKVLRKYLLCSLDENILVDWFDGQASIVGTVHALLVPLTATYINNFSCSGSDPYRSALILKS